ncbi:MAG: outer membrane beta-barrel protein [Gallionellaceae bacterium]|jgi:OOP family OmpA-OmpF porin
MNKIAYAALLFIASIHSAIASDMYIGLKLGNTKHDISVSGYTETASSAGLFAGYSMSPNLAIEAETTNLGSISSGAAKISALSLSAVGTHNFDEQVSLFGKLGVASTREEVSTVVANKAGLTFGFGGQYNVNKTIGLRLGWDRYTYGGEKGLYEGTASMTSLAVLIRF